MGIVFLPQISANLFQIFSCLVLNSLGFSASLPRLLLKSGLSRGYGSAESQLETQCSKIEKIWGRFTEILYEVFKISPHIERCLNIVINNLEDGQVRVGVAR